MLRLTAVVAALALVLRVDEALGAKPLFDDLHSQGKTLIMVTHDLGVGERAARLIRLRDGELESDTRR
jgi:predicted ABC-type transport system involved in lysophospholipase L1 biosynthesis ATPase subunit